MTLTILTVLPLKVSLFSSIIHSMKKILVLLCLLWLPLSASISIKERTPFAEPGDYIVSQQDKNFTVLLIRSFNAPKIVFEEISTPKAQKNWKEWVQARAPGHTSWVVYEIDLSKDQLIECYSYSHQGWLFLDESQHFLAKLISLPLQKIPLEQKKRIGPAPQNGEEDRRSVWNPPLIVEGKKIEKPQFDSFRGIWPKDDTQLSESRIDLYFRKDGSPFFFPHWIEICNGHFTLKIRVLDSGKHLTSPITGAIPRRVINKGSA